MATMNKNNTAPRKRGRPKSKPDPESNSMPGLQPSRKSKPEIQSVSITDMQPPRKSARVAKKMEDNKNKPKRNVIYNEEDWSMDDEDEEEKAENSGMFKKVVDPIKTDQFLNAEDFDDEEEEGEDEEDDDVELIDLFQDEDKDVYDFDQQSSIVSSRHPNGPDKKWMINRQNRIKSAVKMESRDSNNQSSWGSNIYSFIATFLETRADLDLYSQFLKSPIVNRALDLTISDVCKPAKTTNFEGPSATMQRMMHCIDDNEAVVSLMKEAMTSERFMNAAHRISHFVFVVKQPINGLRFYPKFDSIMNAVDLKMVSESAFVLEAEKSEVKKNAPVIDTLVVSDRFFNHINNQVLLHECANLQRLLLGVDENRQLFGVFLLDSWNRTGVPFDQLRSHRETNNAGTTHNASDDSVTLQEMPPPTQSGAGDNYEQQKSSDGYISSKLEFYDGFFVKIPSRKDPLHLVARIESKFVVYNVVSEVNFAFKKHGLSPEMPINLEAMHSTYSEVLGEEKSILVITDTLYKSFTRTLSRETQLPTGGKFKKNVLLDKVSRNPIGVFFDTDVSMTMVYQQQQHDACSSSSSNSAESKSTKRCLTLASLNGIVVGFEISVMKCVTKCFELVSEATLKADAQVNAIQSTVLTKEGCPVTLQFSNIDTHENTVVSAYLYDNVPYIRRQDQIENFVYGVCERIFEMPFQVSVFDSVFRMYQFTLNLNKGGGATNAIVETNNELTSPGGQVSTGQYYCVFCSREFKAAAIAYDHSIRHLGLIKFKCHKHQMLFSDFKSYRCHRDEFLDCDNVSENETELETQKLLNVSAQLTECPRCDKCHDHFPQSDMLAQHQEVCDSVSFSTRTPLEPKMTVGADLDSSDVCRLAATGSDNGMVCGVCGLAYLRMELLCAHMVNHLSCSVCKVRLSSIDEVSVHLRDHTLKKDVVSGPGRKKLLVCDICSDFYGNRNNYYYHQWTEHGVVHPPIKAEETTEPPTKQRRPKRIDELSYIATGTKKFHCKFCDAEVKVSGRDYVKHLDTKHGLSVEMDCLCRVCADIFETPEKLSDHLRLNHIQQGEFINAGIQSIFSCDKCTFFGHFRGVLTHSKTVHCDPNPCLYECPKCPERMADRRLWRLHLEKHEENQTFGCEECQTLFKTEHALKLHQTGFHSVATDPKCRVCSAMFSSLDELQSHVLLSHTEEPEKFGGVALTCSLCGMGAFPSEVELAMHCEVEHNLRHLPEATSLQLNSMAASSSSAGPVAAAMVAVTGAGLAVGAAAGPPHDGSNTCDVCQKTCKTERSLELHRAKHFRTRIFQCTECQATFRSKLAMRRHIRVDHLNLEPERYECQICGKIVTQISMHMLIHKSARYQCEFCGKRFTKSAYYNEHVRIHKNEKPYECHICLRRFNKKSNLNVHVSFHEKHRDDFGNYLEIKPRGRGHPSYDPQKTLARKAAQRKEDVQSGPDVPGGCCVHDDLDYKWAMVALNSKMCSTQDDSSELPNSNEEDPIALAVASVSMANPV